MEHQPKAFARQYSAFISYSHSDRKIAERLAARIEGYRLPGKIARQVGFDRLKPVFRDREEFIASSDLGAAVLAAILDSDFLIVVCTRHTPQSQWVGREIALFRAERGADRILTAQFEPLGGDCFHPELMRRADGSAVEPLAADFDRSGDGRRLALMKLIAPLAGVKLDDLVQRDAQRQIRRMGVAAVAALLVLAAISAVALLALRARAVAAEERSRGADAMHFQLTDLRAKVKASGTLDLAEAVNAGVERFYGQGSAALDTVETRLQRAVLLHARADDHEQRGDLDAAWPQARDAYLATLKLVRDYPDDRKVLFTHAQSAYWLGFVAWRAGNVPLARQAFVQYELLTDELVQGDRRNADWLLEQGYANSNLGMLALREAHDWARARAYFATAQRSFGAAQRREPSDLTPMYELADGEAWLADVDRLSGALPSAERHRQAQRQLIVRLLALDPRNALYRMSFVSNQIGLARIAAEQDRGDDALRQLKAARRMAEELALADPANASVARQKRAVDLFLVQTWLARPVSARPPTRDIDRLLDCASDWKIARGEELAAFCSVQRARFDMMRGRRNAARQLIATPSVAGALRSNTLSPRWRLNFAEERVKLEAELGRPSQ